MEDNQLENLHHLPGPGLKRLVVRGCPQELGTWLELLGKGGPVGLRKLEKLVIADRTEHPAAEIETFEEICKGKGIQLELCWELGELREGET